MGMHIINAIREISEYQNKKNHWFILRKSLKFIFINGESYAIGNKRDLMNQGSTSRFYSFNIYLKPGIIYYKRSYKKLYLIIADGLPIINIVFIFFGLIAKIFKISSHNQKLAELLLILGIGTFFSEETFFLLIFKMLNLSDFFLIKS